MMMKLKSSKLATKGDHIRKFTKNLRKIPYCTVQTFSQLEGCKIFFFLTSAKVLFNAHALEEVAQK